MSTSEPQLVADGIKLLFDRLGYVVALVAGLFFGRTDQPAERPVPPVVPDVRCPHVNCPYHTGQIGDVAESSAE